MRSLWQQREAEVKILKSHGLDQETLKRFMKEVVQAFPFGEEFEKVAGAAWPFDGSEQPLVYGHASRPVPSTPSRPLPVELAASVEEGPDSELGSVREKQKAPPDGDSGRSLPDYSIPARPNPRRRKRGRRRHPPDDTCIYLTSSQWHACLSAYHISCYPYTENKTYVHLFAK